MTDTKVLAAAKQIDVDCSNNNSSYDQPEQRERYIKVETEAIFRRAE